MIITITIITIVIIMISSRRYPRSLNSLYQCKWFVTIDYFINRVNPPSLIQLFSLNR